jgi:hypothetical protein
MTSFAARVVRTFAVLWLATAVSCIRSSGQSGFSPGHSADIDSSDSGLARALASDGQRQAAIELIQASGSTKLPLLLSWTEKPPEGLDPYEFTVGLAEAFGKMKTKEAIPFLVRHVGIRRLRGIDMQPWVKVPEVIERTFPAAMALIEMGADASEPLIRAASGEPRQVEEFNPRGGNYSWDHTGNDARLATIFVISRIGGKHAREFLTMALGQANLEREYAQEGLDSIR